MNFDEIRKALMNAFKSQFEAANPTVPIKYENQKFEQPTGSEWVYATVIQGEGHRMEVSSSSVFRFEGVVNIALMAPEETGTKVLNDMAEDVFDIFADKQFSFTDGTITTHRVEVLTRGTVEGWYIMNVMADFRADQSAY